MKKDKNYLVYRITNNINNMIYIGVHATDNMNDGYMGSGTNIKSAVKEYGKENFEKEILYNFNNHTDMIEKESLLVNKEFIKRKDTYNIYIGGKNYALPYYVTVKDKKGNYSKVHVEDPRYTSGELVHMHKDNLVVKDYNGNTFSIHKEDPRYLSGELVSMFKGTVTVRDNDNNTFRVDINDPRYLSGELKHVKKGIKPSNETKDKMSESSKGRKNGQFGKVWICNHDINKNKTINKDELDKYLEEGWKKGRIISKKHRDSISESMKGNKLSKEAKDKISKNIKNKKWIYNDELELIKFINKEDIDIYLEEGWKLGFRKTYKSK